MTSARLNFNPHTRKLAHKLKSNIKRIFLTDIIQIEHKRKTLRKYTLRLKKVNSNNENNLPIKRNLKLVYILSFIIASLMAVASIAGILFRSMIYARASLNLKKF
jgi:hypothetical protein